MTSPKLALVPARAPEQIRSVLERMRESQLVTINEDEVTVRVPWEYIQEFAAREGSKARLTAFITAYLRAEAQAHGWQTRIVEFFDAPRRQQVITIRRWYA